MRERHKGTEWGEGMTTDFTDRHGSRFVQTVLRNATQVKRLRQDRLALNLDLDRDRDLDPDRKINDLEKEWNMDAQDGQDLE